MQRGLELEERDFFKDRFTEDELWELASEVGIDEIFARRSPSLKELNPDDRELSPGEMLSMMLQEPQLVRRPLVRVGGRLLVGASIKAVEEALG